MKPARPFEAFREPKPAWPQPLLPGKINDWPAGNRTGNDAEMLLHSAEAYWDARYYDGSRYLRNRGQAGNALDLQLGSSNVANTNDPLWLAPEDQGYVYLSGFGYNRIQVADNTQITGDIDLRVLLQVSSWRPSGLFTAIAKWNQNVMSNQKGYKLSVNTDGTLNLYWTANGSTNVQATSSSAIAATAPKKLWLRATLDVDNGAAGNDTIFYTSEDGTNWTKLGNTVTKAGTTSLFASAALFELGCRDAEYETFAGKIYRAQVMSGIGGTTLIDVDFSNIRPDQQYFNTAAGQPVYVLRRSSGPKSVIMPSKKNGGQALFLLGTDDYFEIPAANRQQHRLLNFDAGHSFSVLMHARRTDSASTCALLCKRNSRTSTTEPGWLIYTNASATTATFRVSDGVVTGTQPIADMTGYDPPSALTVIGVRDAPRRVLYGAVTNSPMVTASDTTTGSLYNEVQFRIGRVGSTYTDEEFIAAAIFRRALTQQEIALLADYFKQKQPAYTPIGAAAQKTALASALGINETTYSDALDVLKDAPLYVDSRACNATHYYARNLGTYGDLLAPRLGSGSGSDSNDPKLLVPESAGYVYVSGTGSNQMWVAHESALSITSDIDIAVKAALDNWVPGQSAVLAAKYGSAGNFAWRFQIQSNTGKLQYIWSADGTNIVTITSSVAPTTATGSALWVRATHDVDNGSSGNDVKFWTSSDGITWSQLGTTQTTAGVTSIFASTYRIDIAPLAPSSDVALVGKIYRAIIKSGIAGTTVLDIDCNVVADGRQTSFLAQTGQLVVISRGTSGRKTVVMPNTTTKTMDAANIYLPGVSGNYLSVPDATALDITGDLTLTAFVAADDWRKGATQTIIAKWNSSGDNISYKLSIKEWSGLLVFSWAHYGHTGIGLESTAAIPLADSLWVRAAFDADNGAGAAEVRFYISYNGTDWIQLGNTVTRAGTETGIHLSSAPIEIGSCGGGTTDLLVGRVYRAIVATGLHTSSTPVLDIDCSNAVSGQATFAAGTGQTVTINSTENSGLRVLAAKTGAGVPCFLFGTDDYMEIEGGMQHEVLNFGYGEDFTVLALGRHWPNTLSAALMAKKSSNTGTDAGWTLYRTSTSAHRLYVADGNVNTNGLGAGIDRQLLMDVGVRNRTSNTIAEYSLTSGSSSDTTVLSLANSYSLRIGRLSEAGTSYNDMELYAFAIWRRALSANEINTLAAFFGC